MGDLVASQSLKSPTRETFDALGASSTNRTTVSAALVETGSLSATGGTCPTPWRPSRFSASAPARTPIPTRPAASSDPVTGDSVKERAATTRSHNDTRRLGTGSARTAAMIRSRAAGSVTTGRRASRAINSTYGCRSESVILDTFPAFSQSIARPLDPHLQRGDANTRERRHLLVTQLLDVLEEKRLPQQRVQLTEHPLNEFLLLSRPHHRAVRRVQQQRFLSHEHLVAMRTPSRQAATLIH